MTNVSDSYDFINKKIITMKENYPSLRKKTDDFAFTALCVKSNFFKNPALDFDDRTIENMMVDGTNDGGIDAMLLDQNSDSNDLILVQSKHYHQISYDDVMDAITKMVRFYESMEAGQYNSVQPKVSSLYQKLCSEVGDESKIVFVLYTTALKKNFNEDKAQKEFKALFSNPSRFELYIYFGENLVQEIKDSDSRQPDVESGKIYIDKSKNILEYEDGEAAIVNVSAFSIKSLYGIYFESLLSKNLRYHIKAGSNIDKDISNSIKKNSDDFWFKNNGITIICEDFDVSGTEVKLEHFSIINGGQTTYNLYNSDSLDKNHDFFLPCKIIKIRGENDEEKSAFSLEIAKATNSQKPIKPIDLKANSYEQVHFSSLMKGEGLFYQTKRGEKAPKDKAPYQSCYLTKLGKLCLSAIFQIPCTSRNKPSVLYTSKFYNPLFNEYPELVAGLSEQLLYMDYYFSNAFLKEFKDKEQAEPNSDTLLEFAQNSRTICIAFATLASRYYNGNISKDGLSVIFKNTKADSSDSYDRAMYDIFKNMNGIKKLFPDSVYSNKAEFDSILYKLYDAIIKNGSELYSWKKEESEDVPLNASNFLKKDSNYYLILKNKWSSLSSTIKEVFGQF